MSLFGFFKKAAASKGHAPTPRPTTSATKGIGSLSDELAAGRIPTVKAPSELFGAYDEMFFEVMKTVKAFSKKEVEDMHRMITTGDGGYLNQGRYHEAVFEAFFEGREWSWPEFDRWERIFTDYGKFPSTWAVNRPGFAGGSCSVVMRPWPHFPAQHNTALRLQLAGYSRSAQAVCGG